VAQYDTTGFRGTGILPILVSHLTSSLFELGELAAVDSIVGAAIRNQSRIRGEYSSGMLSFLYGLGKLRLGDLDSADAWLARAMRDTTQGSGGLAGYLPPAITQLYLEQGKTTDARKSLGGLPSGTFVRRVNRSWFAARIRHAEGNTRGAAAMLEDSLRVLSANATNLPPSLAMPFVTAAEWRLAAGDARGADSLARLARSAGAIDSVALQRNAYVGRAELVRARALASFGTLEDARSAAQRAVVASTNGYGAANRHTREALALRASLSK
jgi:hypothetical protein